MPRKNPSAIIERKGTILQGIVNQEVADFGRALSESFCVLGHPI
jgi:hypothetical protein